MFKTALQRTTGILRKIPIGKMRRSPELEENV